MLWLNYLLMLLAGFFTKFTDKNDLIPMPVAHGEGRFTTTDKELIKQLIKNTIRYKQEGYPVGYTMACLNYMLQWPYDYYQKVDLSNKNHSKHERKSKNIR